VFAENFGRIYRCVSGGSTCNNILSSMAYIRSSWTTGVHRLIDGRFITYKG
jgi:hypothetical protein